jgi:integration host factor subunit beta
LIVPGDGRGEKISEQDRSKFPLKFWGLLPKTLHGINFFKLQELVFSKEKEEMTKFQLIQKLMEKSSNLAQQDAKTIVNTIFSSMSDALVKGERIEIRGFGNFTVRTYQSYLGRNPRTGTKVEVSPKRLPFFKVGKELKERVDAPPPSPTTE